MVKPAKKRPILRRKHSSSYGTRNREYRNSCLGALVSINNLTWDIRDEPLTAVLKSSKTSGAEVLDELWCVDKITLLLPIMKYNDNTSVVVYHQEVIRKRNLCFGDILYRIWKFYTASRVVKGDLTYVAVSEEMKSFVENAILNDENARSLRFFHLLQGQTKFAGLKSQDDFVYSLELSTF